MGIYTGISMVFLALGPLVGGLLTQGVSWRAVFFVNLPIGVAIVAAAHFTLPHRPRPRIPRGAIDWTGIPLLVGGLGALVLGLMQGQTWGWGSPAIIALLAAAAVLIPVFLWWESRAPAPLVTLQLFREQNFGADSAVLAGVQFALVGASVFGAVWSQQVLGFSAIHAGAGHAAADRAAAVRCAAGRSRLRPLRPAAAAGHRRAAHRRRPGLAGLAPAPA